MHLQSAIENLHKRSSDIEHYYNLIGKIQTTDISADEDFQREFIFSIKSDAMLIREKPIMICLKNSKQKMM